MKRVFCCLFLVMAMPSRSRAQGAVASFRTSGPVNLRDSALSSEIKGEIAVAIAKQFQTMPGEPSGRAIAMTSWVSRIQLAERGPLAIVVNGGPDDYDNGATGNNDLWIFRVSGGHASLVLTGGGFGLRPVSKIHHHGLVDLQTGWNMSCCDGEIEVYRFDGQRYQPAYCYSYTSDENGKMAFGPHVRCAE